MITEELIEAIEGATVHNLSHDDVVDLVDGFYLKAVVDYDPDTQVTDYDCYGEIVQTCGDWGGAVRPSSMDGAARILTRGPAQGTCTWWQPWEEIKSNPEAIEEQADLITQLLTEGYKWVALDSASP